MKKGFTLIELLVVVLIIGILSAIALPQYKKAVARSRAVQGMAWIDAIVTAQKIYYMANGEYAADLNDIDAGLPPEHTCFMYKQIEALCRIELGGGETIHISYLLPRDRLWCRTIGRREGFGDEVCKTFGKLDTDFSNDANGANYYLIN